MDEKNGNNDGLVDFDEFLPWYTSIAEKHYKFVMATAEPEVIRQPAKQAPALLTPLTRR